LQLKEPANTGLHTELHDICGARSNILIWKIHPHEKLILKCFNSRKVWKSKGAEEPKFVILEDTGTQKDSINELGNSDTYPKYL
jgi:hypothetical protein